MKWRWLVVVLSLVVGSGVALGEEVGRPSLPEDISNLSYEIYKKCEKSGNSEATIKCLMRNDKRYGAEITRMYEYLLGRVNKDRAELLRESQRYALLRLLRIDVLLDNMAQQSSLLTI